MIERLTIPRIQHDRNRRISLISIRKQVHPHSLCVLVKHTRRRLGPTMHFQAQFSNDLWDVGSHAVFPSEDFVAVGDGFHGSVGEEVVCSRSEFVALGYRDISPAVLRKQSKNRFEFEQQSKKNHG